MDHYDQLDAVDAMVFSGDSLYNKESLKIFRAFLERWTKEADLIQECIDDTNSQKIPSH